MRILMCTHEYYPMGSGIANLVYNLNKSLTRLGHSVDICSPIGPDIKLEEAVKPIERFGGFGIAYFWYKVGGLLETKHKEYDLILLHNPLLFREVKAKNIVCVVHTLFYFIFKESDWRNIKKLPYYLGMLALESYAYKHMRHLSFAVTSPKTISELEHYGIKPEGVPIIYNGHDFSATPVKSLPKSLEYLKSKQGIRLVYVGRFAYKKNLPRLLLVFKHLRELSNIYHLYLIPHMNESTKAIESLIETKGIQGVTILRGISHVVLLSIYKHFDFFISASNYEGFPLVLSEAVSNGLVPILSPLPVYQHILKKLGCGLIVDFNKDAEMAANSIHNFCRRVNKEKDSRKLIKKAKILFDWDKIAQQYLALKP